jgi:hypothetical protein
MYQYFSQLVLFSSRQKITYLHLPLLPLLRLLPHRYSLSGQGVTIGITFLDAPKTPSG